MTVGLPENLRDGSSISVVKVTDGGNIQVLQDKDNNPNTVSFAVTEGEAAYALITTFAIWKDYTALKAEVKALLNDKEGIGQFMGTDDLDNLVNYLYDKPDEQDFLDR